MKNNFIKPYLFCCWQFFYFQFVEKINLKTDHLNGLNPEVFSLSALMMNFLQWFFVQKRMLDSRVLTLIWLKKLAKRLGVRVQFKSQLWDGILMSLNTGDIDVIWTGLTPTDERKQKIDFTKPYLNNRQIIMVTTGSAIDNFDTLKDKKVGASTWQQQ